jgi:glycine/D-amino acid oxidase-like deaminating enzyme
MFDQWSNIFSPKKITQAVRSHAQAEGPKTHEQNVYHEQINSNK